MLSPFIHFLKNNPCRDISLTRASWGAVNEVITLILTVLLVFCVSLCYILSSFFLHLLMLYSFLVMDLFIYFLYSCTVFNTIVCNLPA